MNWSGFGSRTSWRPRICSTLGGWSCCGTTGGGAGRDDCAAAGAGASATAAAQAAISFAGKAGENDRSILLLLDSRLDRRRAPLLLVVRHRRECDFGGSRQDTTAHLCAPARASGATTTESERR